MTDTIPFAPPQSVDEDVPTDRKKLLVLCAAAGAVVLAAGGYLLLHGGGDDTAATGPVVSHVVTPHIVTKGKPIAPAKAPVAAATAIKPAATLPVESTARLGRDPFKALYVAPAAPAAGTTGSNVGDPTGTGTTGTAAGTGTSTAAKTYALKLTGVSGTGKSQTASFVLDGKRQDARVGSVFGPTQEIKLLSFQEAGKGQWTTVLQVGDSAPFDAALGVTVFVA